MIDSPQIAFHQTAESSVIFKLFSIQMHLFELI